MKATYDLNTNGCLILTADAIEREAIAQMVADHGCETCSRCEQDALDSLIANSELEWVQPEYIGALTDAPILGIYEDDKPLPKGQDELYARITGHWDGVTWYSPVFAAWGYMDYQVRSFLADLVDNGKAVFISSGRVPRP